MSDTETGRIPKIYRLGTIKPDTVETTPVVFGGRLYRFEYCRGIAGGDPCFRFVDAETGAPLPSFARGHHLGSAFADGDTVYAAGVDKEWGGDTLHFFASRDPVRWEQTAEFALPGWKIFNTGVCRYKGGYLLLLEISEPAEEAGVPFTFRFAVSPDMKSWTLTPPECVFQKDRYAGGPAVYNIGDGFVYVLFLEALAGPRYETGIARSQDLIHWEYSPRNPVMSPCPEDKGIRDPLLGQADRRRIREAVNINNSDLELCEYKGKTVIYYSWGNQQGNEFLAEARFDGGLKEFLQGWF